MVRIYTDAGKVAAKIVSDSGAVKDAAEDIARLARIEASKHIDDGDYIGSIEVDGRPGEGRGSYVMDWVARATDPAAVPIEYGHTKKNGTRVPGQYIFTNVYGRL